MNREKMGLKKTVHSHYVRWGVASSEPDGWFHGARVHRRDYAARTHVRGSDVRERIKV